MRTSLLAVAVVVGFTGAASAEVTRNPASPSQASPSQANPTQASPTHAPAVESAVRRTNPVGKRVLGRHIALITQADAHRARRRELARQQLRHGQSDVAILDGLLPSLPGVLSVPAPHADAQAWPIGMVINVVPRRTYWTTPPPCMPRCSHELARCGMIAAAPIQEAPMWPWIAAMAVLAGGALLLIACERRLLEPLP